MLLRQVSNLAPVAQVVVYTVMPGGEAVADSQDFPVQLCLNNKVQPPALQELGRWDGGTVWSDPGVSAGLPQVLRPPGASGGEDHAQSEGSPGLPVLCQGRRPERPPAAVGGGTLRPLCTSRGVSDAAADPDRLLTLCCSAQVFQRLPFQKLPGYMYDVEDHEPYPCLPGPGPGPIDLPGPDIEEAGRSKRSFIYEPPDQKNDVYSIFQVPERSRFRCAVGNVPASDDGIFFLSRKSGSSF